jgi:hypothetical protein
MKGTCRVCGCTDADCRGCIERTGLACSWVLPDLCSACAPDAAITEEEVARGTFDEVLYHLGDRGDLRDEAKRAADLVAVAGMQPQARLSILIGGYDEDPRELFDIPEVMAFLKRIANAMPEDALRTVMPRFDKSSLALFLVAVGHIRRDQVMVVPREGTAVH